DKQKQANNLADTNCCGAAKSRRPLELFPPVYHNAISSCPRTSNDHAGISTFLPCCSAVVADLARIKIMVQLFPFTVVIPNTIIFLSIIASIKTLVVIVEFTVLILAVTWHRICERASIDESGLDLEVNGSHEFFFAERPYAHVSIRSSAAGGLMPKFEFGLDPQHHDERYNCNGGHIMIEPPTDSGADEWLGDGNSWYDPSKTWSETYTFDPLANLTKAQCKLANNFYGVSSLVPKKIDMIVSPTATALNVTEALPRLHDVRYRLIQRGVNPIPLQLQ
ncbi:hypothetical protein EV424DRAFT_1627786, partial [Suillus variegatus]